MSPNTFGLRMGSDYASCETLPPESIECLRAVDHTEGSARRLPQLGGSTSALMATNPIG